jgi:LPS sulfotransferase NodH
VEPGTKVVDHPGHSRVIDAVVALGGIEAQVEECIPRRVHVVAQAVSLWKAIQTQQWRTESESDAEAVDIDEGPGVDYDYRAIEYLLNQLHLWDARWEEWFHATGREPIRVFYDEFTVSRAATIGRVLDALGIDPPAPQGKKPMQRQDDDRSRDWVARFRSDSEHRQRI